MNEKEELGIFQCKVFKNGKVDPKHTKSFGNQYLLGKYYYERIKHYQIKDQTEVTSRESSGCCAFFKYAQGGIDKHQKNVDVEYSANFTLGRGCFK